LSSSADIEHWLAFVAVLQFELELELMHTHNLHKSSCCGQKPTAEAGARAVRKRSERNGVMWASAGVASRLSIGLCGYVLIIGAL
jgi:hypothetical protein